MKLKKFFLLLLGIFIFVFIPNNVYAYSVNELRLYYYSDSQQQIVSTNNARTMSWDSIDVVYIDKPFYTGSFTDIAQQLYAFMPSGLGCTGSGCRLTGTFMTYTYLDATPGVVSDLDVQVETNSRYYSCSISSARVSSLYFAYYDFVCYAPNLNRGFNIVFNNLPRYDDNSIYYGLAYNTLNIEEDVSFTDLINSNANNTNTIMFGITNLQNNLQNTISTLNNQLTQNNNQNAQNIIDASRYDSQQLQNSVNGVNNSINDDSTDPTYQNSTLNDLNSQLASNNVISDLLLLPVRMYQKILDSLGSNSCTSYNLGSLYGTDLILPCIQVQNYIGSALWTTIDLIFCGMFILVIRKKFVDIFNNITNLKDGGNEIE